MTTRFLSQGILYLLFAASGFCALVYEILWTKYLSLTFGTTMPAVAIVAATFMAGLAFGSYLLGRFVDRQANLLKIYAALELGIAVTALALPPTLNIVTDLHIFIENLLPGHPLFTYTVHCFFTAMLLVPPTLCMGGTFPLMCRFFTRKNIGSQIGRLYALNTLGATAGAFGAGYLLIPTLGLSTTGYLAVILNLAIAASSWALSRSHGAHPVSKDSPATRPLQPIRAHRYRGTLLAIALVGFFSLGYEILWTRTLLLFLGNTSYAFSMMLSAYLVGIAIGGALYSRMIHRSLDQKKVFITLAFFMGLTVLATCPFYDRLVHLFQWAHVASGERWWHLTLLNLCIVFAVIAPPTALSGALLPAAVAILNPGRSHTGEGVGLVVLHNTLGAVLGSLITAFFLIPLTGLQGTFRLLAGTNILLALMLYLHFRPPRLKPAAVTALAAAGLLLFLLPVKWDQKLMNSGVYIYATRYARDGGLASVLAQEQLVRVIEGMESTVAVYQSPDTRHRFFTVNGKTDGGTGGDMATQLLVGQLPMLLHPDPGTALVVGLGTGITLRGLSAHPVQEIDCVEISPSVVEASRYFEDANGGALNDPKVHLQIKDGRNHLLVSSKRYDVIISEPSNPWQSGNANLFTHDFYQLALRRLKPGGLFSQWIGLYDITPENLRIACRTFLQSFPRVLAFRVGSDLILVGSTSPVRFDLTGMDQRLSLPGVGEALARAGIHSPGDLLAAYYLCTDASLREFSGDTVLNTDDFPVLEFSARHLLGKNLSGRLQMANIAALKDHLTRVDLPLAQLGATPDKVAENLRNLGQSYRRAGKTDQARHFFVKAEEIEKARSDRG